MRKPSRSTSSQTDLPELKNGLLEGYMKIAEKDGTKVYRKGKEVIKIQEIPKGFNIVENVDCIKQKTEKLGKIGVHTLQTMVVLPEGNEYFENRAVLIKSNFLKGVTLDCFLKNRVPRIIKKDIILKILKILKQCHDMGLLHGDIKMENVWIRKKLFGYHLVIADFNLFHSNESIFAAPEFLAPEVNTSDDYTISSEIWSIGMLVYFILSGGFPFKSRNDGLTIGEVREGIKNNNFTISKYTKTYEGYEMFFEKSLHPEPQKRAKFLTELIDELNR